MPTNYHTQLLNLLDSIIPIPASEQQWLNAQLLTRQWPAKQVLVAPGSQDKSIYFLCGGLLRYYYLDHDGSERNHAFVQAGQLAGCFAAIGGVGSCEYSIETLEDTHALIIPDNAVSALSRRHACWLELQMRLMAHVAKRKTEREHELITLSAEQRYERFQQTFSDIIDRIPQYHIASYLAVTPVALSRIRKRLQS